MEISLRNITKKYHDKIVFQEFSYIFKNGKITGITGKSGSGKTTLLNMLGLIEKADAGEVVLFNKRNIKLYSREARLMHKNEIGYIFQNFALIPDRSIEENLKLAMSSDIKITAKEAMKIVGLKNDLKQLVAECSGGEQQRIAIARLYLKKCSLILADEPTGSLDSENAKLVMHLLKDLNSKGKTIIIATHDPQIINQCDEVLCL